jgi:hypothetical protein
MPQQRQGISRQQAEVSSQKVVAERKSGMIF